MASEPAYYVKIGCNAQIITIHVASLEDADSLFEAVTSAWVSGEIVEIRSCEIRDHSGRRLEALALNPALVASAGIEVHLPGVREW